MGKHTSRLPACFKGCFGAPSSKKRSDLPNQGGSSSNIEIADQNGQGAGAADAQASMGVSRKLPKRVKLAYAMPRGATVGMVLLVQAVVRPYYIDGLGMEISRQAMLVAICKSIDFLIGFIVGYTSDHMEHKTIRGFRFGRRTLYIMFGFPVWLVCFFLLANPPSLDSVEQVEEIGYCSTEQEMGTSDSCPELEACLSALISNGTLPAYRSEQVISEDTFAGPLLSAWFCLFYFAYYSIGFTFTIIPYDALGMELTDDYNERSVLFGYKGAFQFTGYLIFAGLASSMAQLYPDSIPTQIMYPSFFFVVAVTLAFLFLFKTIRERDLPPRQEMSVIPSVMQTLRNGPYLIYLMMKVPLSIANMTPVAMMPYFLKIVMQEENTYYWFGVLLGVVLCSSILGTPILVYLQEKVLDKRSVLLYISAVFGIAAVGITFVEEVSRTLVLIVGAGLGIILSGTQIIPDAILGDIIDYDELHTGERNEGVYTIVETNLQQWIEIPAGVVPLMWLALEGYENNAMCSCGCGVACPEKWLRWNCSENSAGDTGYACSTGATSTLLFEEDRTAPCTQQSDDIKWVLRICTFLIPGVCMLVAIIPILLGPVTREKHAEILKQIKRRHENKQVIDPLTGLPIRLRKAELEDDRFLVESFTTKDLQAGMRGGRTKLMTRIFNQSAIIIVLLIAIIAIIIIYPTSNVVTLSALALAFFFMIVPWQIGKMRLLKSIDDTEFDHTLDIFESRQDQVAADKEALEQGTLDWGRDGANSRDGASAGDSASSKSVSKSMNGKKQRSRNDIKRDLKSNLEKMKDFKKQGVETLSDDDQRAYKLLKIEAKKLKSELDNGTSSNMIES